MMNRINWKVHLNTFTKKMSSCWNNKKTWVNTIYREESSNPSLGPLPAEPWGAVDADGSAEGAEDDLADSAESRAAALLCVVQKVWKCEILTNCSRNLTICAWYQNYVIYDIECILYNKYLKCRLIIWMQFIKKSEISIFCFLCIY